MFLQNYTLCVCYEKQLSHDIIIIFPYNYDIIQSCTHVLIIVKHQQQMSTSTCNNNINCLDYKSIRIHYQSLIYM